MNKAALSEYEFEPVRGLPATLPQGEELLWQGAPQWRSLARRAFHTRKVAIYFAVLLLWSVSSALADGAGIGAASAAALWLLPVALAGIGILAGLAWGYSRTTVYTITDKRIVMRFGIALPMTINIPFCLINAAALKSYTDGTGDLPLTLNGGERIAYLVLWPNARPWRVKQPQPMLRSIADADHVAELLAQALADAATDAPPRISRVANKRPTAGRSGHSTKTVAAA